MIDKCVPGPGSLQISNSFGSDAAKFSMTGKDFDIGLKRAKNEPGPGDYKQMSINREGKYSLSQFSNTFSFSFGISKEKRFSYSSYKDKLPAPSKYDIKSLISGKGFIFPSKFRSSNAFSMTGKGKDVTTKFSNYKSKFLFKLLQLRDQDHTPPFQSLEFTAILEK